MKQKNSFMSKGLLGNILKANYLVAVLIFGVFTVFGTAPYYLMNRREKVNLLTLDVDTMITFALIIVSFASLIAVAIVYRRLFAKNSVEVFHSMPIRRGSIYGSHIIATLILVLIPLTITSILLLIIGVAYIPENNGIILLVSMVSVALVIFLITLMGLCGSLTGNTVMQVILMNWLVYLPTGILYGLNAIFVRFVNGYIPCFAPYPWLKEVNIFYNYRQFSHYPLVLAETGEINVGDYMIKLVILPIIISLLFFFLGNRCYKRRKIENFSIINRKWLKIFMIISLSMMGAILVGANEIVRFFPGKDFMNFIVSSGFGMVIGFIIGVAISYQNFYLYRYYKQGILVMGITSISLLAMIGIGNVHYSKLPDADLVDYIEFQPGRIHSNILELDFSEEEWPFSEESDKYLSQELKENYHYTKANTFEDRENIGRLLLGLEDLLENQSIECHSFAGFYRDSYDAGFYVAIYMKNGKLIKRWYRFDELDDFYYNHPEIKSVYLSREAKVKIREFYRYDQAMIQSVIIENREKDTCIEYTKKENPEVIERVLKRMDEEVEEMEFFEDHNLLILKMNNRNRFGGDEEKVGILLNYKLQNSDMTLCFKVDHPAEYYVGQE